MSMGVVYDWWAGPYSGSAPTSDIVYVYAGEWDFTGINNFIITVSHYISPGVLATATDSHQVNIVDKIPPVINDVPSPQTVVLGADNLLVINFYDNIMPLTDANHVKLTVNGMPAPSDKVAIKNAGMTGGQVELQTDWLSPGKHKMTLTVIDNAGNKDKASWVV